MTAALVYALAALTVFALALALMDGEPIDGPAIAVAAFVGLVWPAILPAVSLHVAIKRARRAKGGA